LSPKLNKFLNYFPSHMEEWVDHIKEVFNKFKIVRTSKPGIFRRFSNWIKSFFSKSITLVYDMNTLLEKFFVVEPENRFNGF